MSNIFTDPFGGMAQSVLGAWVAMMLKIIRESAVARAVPAKVVLGTAPHDVKISPYGEFWIHHLPVPVV
jgi:hypothetical protein